LVGGEQFAVAGDWQALESGGERLGGGGDVDDFDGDGEEARRDVDGHLVLLARPVGVEDRQHLVGLADDCPTQHCVHRWGAAADDDDGKIG
jgi:hypothetical protein